MSLISSFISSITPKHPEETKVNKTKILVNGFESINFPTTPFL
jgi:hypothetical protein